MAVRLSVVMVHTAPPTSLGQRLAETLVGELIGRPGIDVVLVGPLSQWGEGSTDRLTLESISGDLVVMAWQSVEATIENLRAIEFSGHRSPHAQDADAPAAPLGSRRLYGFDLNRFSSAEPIIESLMQLRQARSVTTFSIASLAAKPVSPGRPTAKPPLPGLGQSATVPPTPELPSATADPASLDLDDLLDQLDRSDS